MAVDFKEYGRRMDKALDHLNDEFGAVRAGRANWDRQKTVANVCAV